MYFLVFHGKERFGKAHHDHAAHDDHHHGLVPGQKPHESSWVVTLPLILLAIPSVVIGYFTIDTMLFGDFLKGVIAVDEAHPAMAALSKGFHGAAAMGLHAVMTLPFWLALAGVASAYYFYLVNPKVPAWIYARFSILHRILDNKYYMDKFNEVVFAGGARLLGRGLWRAGDVALIDGLIVNGSAKLMGWVGRKIRHLQSGYVYHYAFVMIIGILLFMAYFIPFSFK
jgi:NADH-quinone oxidoreductase subunit L